MVGVVRSVKPSRLRLLRREETALGFRDGEKCCLVLLKRPLHPHNHNSRESACNINSVSLTLFIHPRRDLIPEAAAEKIIGEIHALLARHNAGAALSAKAMFKLTKESARHTLDSADENMEIDSRALRECETDSALRNPAPGRGAGQTRVNVAPVAASVKTKLGRGGSED